MRAGYYLKLDLRKFFPDTESYHKFLIRIKKTGGNMREILFRGKRAAGGQWVEGGITFDASKTPYICPERFSDYDEEIEVIPATVGQFTGLTDKNGKKIFEGDILLIDVESEHPDKDKRKERHITKAVVVFENGEFTLQGKELVLFTYYGVKYLHKAASFKKYEVIGNIYGNAALLECEGKSEQKKCKYVKDGKCTNSCAEAIDCPTETYDKDSAYSNCDWYEPDSDK